MIKNDYICKTIIKLKTMKKSVKELVDSLPFEKIKKEFYRELNKKFEHFMSGRQMPFLRKMYNNLSDKEKPNMTFEEYNMDMILSAEVESFFEACWKNIMLDESEMGEDFWIVTCALVDSYLDAVEMKNNLESEEILSKIKKEMDEQI